MQGIETRRYPLIIRSGDRNGGEVVDEAERWSGHAGRNRCFHPDRVRDGRETDTGGESTPDQGGADYGERPRGVLSILPPTGTHSQVGEEFIGERDEREIQDRRGQVLPGEDGIVDRGLRGVPTPKSSESRNRDTVRYRFVPQEVLCVESSG